eukprot:CAMPEP_0115318332 /NCGR_PEP_ID=MMETSP0270-20121206/79149_1 /TAXON_ID=71861 /ORGANISM="Scrippsiella trochoidea, Strain CCMP3099" /LENGTH=59 /DNA_ID=CAMNT_0002737897 /DNA_START=35 /DNA_END=210 /DNA_ORIENTATION=+
MALVAPRPAKPCFSSALKAALSNVWKQRSLKVNSKWSASSPQSPSSSSSSSSPTASSIA